MRFKMRPSEHAINVVASFGVAATIAMVILAWRTLPDRIAHHFDFAGSPDAWGGPSVLLLLPAISVAMYAMLTFVAHSPHRFNYPWPITEQNAERQYRITLSMLLMLKAEIAIMFCYITWVIIRSANDNNASLGRAFLPFVVAAVFLTLLVHLAAAYRAR
jgi:uncharacterized membrane protein